MNSSAEIVAVLVVVMIVVIIHLPTAQVVLLPFGFLFAWKTNWCDELRHSKFFHHYIGVSLLLTIVVVGNYLIPNGVKIFAHLETFYSFLIRLLT